MCLCGGMGRWFGGSGNLKFLHMFFDAISRGHDEVTPNYVALQEDIQKKSVFLAFHGETDSW